MITISLSRSFPNEWFQTEHAATVVARFVPYSSLQTILDVWIWMLTTVRQHASCFHYLDILHLLGWTSMLMLTVFELFSFILKHSILIWQIWWTNLKWVQLLLCTTSRWKWLKDEWGLRLISGALSTKRRHKFVAIFFPIPTFLKLSTSTLGKRKKVVTKELGMFRQCNVAHKFDKKRTWKSHARDRMFT